MSWIYGLAALAAAGVLAYLVVALFHPEFFE